VGDEDGQVRRHPLELVVDFEREDAALAFADAMEAVPRHRYRVREIMDVTDDGANWWTVVVLTEGDDVMSAEEALRPLAEKYSSGEVQRI
jgi:hypothetical protein